MANRLLLESAFCGGSSYFVTLTYNEENVMYALPPNSHTGSWSPAFDKDYIQKFLKRLRKKYVFKYIMVSELGDLTSRSHHHACFFLRKTVPLGEFTEFVEKVWDRGFITVSPINDNRLAYTVKYCLKEDYEDFKKDKHFLTVRDNYSPWDKDFLLFQKEYEDLRQPFRLFSSRPGLGDCAIPFLNEYLYNDGNIRTTLNINGKPLSLDRFLKDHIDPSLSAEVKALTYEQNFEDIQDNLRKSFFGHALKHFDGKYENDYRTDDKILKRRRDARLYKKIAKF